MIMKYLKFDSSVLTVMLRTARVGLGRPKQTLKMTHRMFAVPPPVMSVFHKDYDGLGWFTMVGKGNKERQIAVSDTMLAAGDVIRD